MEMEELQVEVVTRPAHTSQSADARDPERVNSQHTPKPTAQLPSAEPPRVEHSELMMTVILGDTRGVEIFRISGCMM